MAAHGSIEDASLLEEDTETQQAINGGIGGRRLWKTVGVAALVCCALLSLGVMTKVPTRASAVELGAADESILRMYPASHTGSTVDRSPALVWQSLQHQDPKAGEGLQKIKDIQSGHVIDDFMAKYPEIRTILWDQHSDGPATVALVEAYAKKLTINTDLDSYMSSKGFTFERKSTKRTHWVKGSMKISAKTTTDWKETNGPNNGFMRIFFHDVAVKLRQFNSKYGWDDSLIDGLFDGETLTLVNKHYDKDWTEAETPRHWILPQMHYLGIFANDIASGKDQNFAIADGEPRVATPVDLDATWRGEYYSFLKVLTPGQAIEKMELNYIQIH
mmetsp:Transcript_112367/g.312673  ORF Transcript_112367/g.312673 Transcript_112367/m.312673 type:complete len:331 (+) Transcript_112367:61-1053(+)